MSNFRVDSNVPFLKDDSGRLAGYVDDNGAERSLLGFPLRSESPQFYPQMHTPSHLGLRGCVFGASTVMRTITQRGWLGGDYSRTASGLVTVKVKSGGGLAMRLLPGSWVQITNTQFPQVEYLGPILSAAVDGSQDTTITYQDIAGSPMPGCPTGGDCHDMKSGSIQSNWKVGFDLATDGAVDLEVIGCGGTNMLDWPASRMKRVADRAQAIGGFDFIFVCLAANLINAAGLGEVSALQEIFRLLDQLHPLARRVILEPPDGGRGAVQTTPVYTSAMRLLRKVYTEAVRRYPNVMVAQTTEVLGSNWSPYNVTTPLDVKRCWAPALWMNSGNSPMVHYNWPAAIKVGATRAATILPMLQNWGAENGSAGDNQWANPNVDPNGNYNVNAWSGFFGQVTAKGSADTPATGKQPTGTTFAVATPGGSMAAVMSLPANPEGGTDWLTVITDSAGATNGTTFTWALQGAGTNTLLAALNATKNQGKRLRLVCPLEVSWDNEYTVTTVELGLFATITGVEYNLCAPLSNDGLFSLPGIGPTHLGPTDCTIAAGGTGYVVGDVLNVVGGTKTATAQFTVTQVNAGAVTDGYFSNFGDYTASPGNPAATTGGTGTGCTLTATWLTLARGMDYGFCGALREPSPFVQSLPVGTVATAAELRLVIFGASQNNAIGELRVRFGREARVEFIDW